jgi:hypothetical protein
MKKLIITLSLFLICNITFAQDDWKLPMVKDKIVFDFTSPIMEGKTDLCEIYTSMDFRMAIIKKCTDLYINKSLSKMPGMFSKHNTTQIYANLYGATSGVGGEGNVPKCIKGKPDTLVGSLDMTLETSKFFSGYKGGQITCMYRIILYNDKINVKFKGFELKASKVRNATSSAGGPAKSLETETRPLEEEYKNMQTKKVDKEYWSDFKSIVGMFYKMLESELARRRGALNFED